MVFADVSVRAAIRRMYKRAEWQLADVVVRAAIKGRFTDTEGKEGRSESSLVILTANENLDRLLETLDKYAAAIAARGVLWLQSGISGRQPPSLAQGNVPLLSTMEGEDLERFKPPLEPLTPRQLDILRLLARGRTNREIAEELILSPGTVRTHVQRIIAKLRARDRTTAVVRAIQLGIISSEPED
jgi:RNA polymerase sigma factor (sigma-70 family)